MAPKEARPQAVRVAEVAAMLACSKPTVYRLLNAGELPEVRFGRSRRVPLDAIQAMIRGTNAKAKG